MSVPQTGDNVAQLAAATAGYTITVSFTDHTTPYDLIHYHESSEHSGIADVYLYDPFKILNEHPIMNSDMDCDMTLGYTCSLEWKSHRYSDPGCHYFLR